MSEYNKKDHYYYKAKELNYAARSVFKLEEIDQRYKIIQKNMTVLDLGAAPGSWSQFLSKKIGPGGKILGIDLEPITIHLPNALFIQKDIHEMEWEKFLPEHGFPLTFDLVVSDMAPKTTGIKLSDQMRSLDLCEMALFITQNRLKKSGAFICKFFDGPGFDSIRAQLRTQFNKVTILRPKSTRKESKEIFFICTDKKDTSK